MASLWGQGRLASGGEPQSARPRACARHPGQPESVRCSGCGVGLCEACWLSDVDQQPVLASLAVRGRPVSARDAFPRAAGVAVAAVGTAPLALPLLHLAGLR